MTYIIAIPGIAFVICYWAAIYYKFKVKRRLKQLPKGIIRIHFMMASFDFMLPISIKKLKASGISVNDELAVIIKKANLYLYLGVALAVVTISLMLFLSFYYPNSLL